MEENLCELGIMVFSFLFNGGSDSEDDTNHKTHDDSIGKLTMIHWIADDDPLDS